MKGRPPPGPSERTGSPTRLAQSVRRCGRARGAAALAPWRAARIPGARTAARARPPPAAHSAPCRPLRARPSSGRRARAAALAAPRWLHRAHPRAARGLRGVNPEVHGPAGRGAGVRASGREAGGGLRRSLPHGDSTRDLSQPPRRAAPPSPRSRLRAGLRSTLLTCWTRTRAHPPPTAPRAAHLHGLMVAPPGGLSLPEGARPQGTRNPGAGGPGGVGPSSSARALRPAAARTHLPAAAPRRVIGCPRPARQIEPSIHSWAGRARAAATGLCPARAPPRSRARPPSTAAALPGASPGPVSAHGPHGPAVLREALSVGLRPFLLASVARPVGSTEYERWRQPALVSSAPRSVR